MMYYIMQQTPLHLHSAAPVSAHSEADVRLIEKTKSRGYPQRKLGSRQHRYTDGDDIVCVRYSDCVQLREDLTSPGGHDPWLLYLRKSCMVRAMFPGPVTLFP